MDIETVDWAALRAPFAAEELDFRPLRAFKRDGKDVAEVAAYVDARAVAARLDAVVGPGSWAFDWEPVVVTGGAVMAAKGVLTICGVAKADVGDPASGTEPTKASVSDSLKRAAVLWGIGRELYSLPRLYADMDGKYLARGEEEKLRAKVAAHLAGTRTGARASQPRPAPERKAEAATPANPRPAPAPAPRPAPSATRDYGPGTSGGPMGPGARPPSTSGTDEPEATPAQRTAIAQLCRRLGHEVPTGALTQEAARALITTLSAESREAAQRAS